MNRILEINDNYVVRDLHNYSEIVCQNQDGPIEIIISIENDYKNSFKILLKKNAEVKIMLVYLINKNIDLDLQVILESESKLFLYGLCSNNENCKKRLNCKIISHENVTSYTKIFGVLNDESVTNVFLNNEIPLESINCDIDQNIFLYLNSTKAKAEALPILDIQNNNVKKARHACVVGQIFGEILYYMQTRGVSLTKAKKAILNTHSQEMMNNFDKKNIKIIKGLVK